MKYLGIATATGINIRATEFISKINFFILYFFFDRQYAVATVIKSVKRTVLPVVKILLNKYLVTGIALFEEVAVRLMKFCNVGRVVNSFGGYTSNSSSGLKAFENTNSKGSAVTIANGIKYR